MQELPSISATDPLAGVDVDALQRTEAALRERERELTHLVDMVPSHLWRLSPAGEPIFFNRRMVDYLGFGLEGTERRGSTRLDVLIQRTVHPDDQSTFRSGLSQSLATGQAFALRYRLRRHDGVYRWMSSRAEPMHDDMGIVRQWYGLCHDIDDQIRGEEAVRRREHDLRMLVDTVPVQIWCTTPAGEPSYINKTMADYIGLWLGDFDEAGGLPSAIRQLVHPDDRSGLQAALYHCFTTGSPFEMTYRNQRWDGVYRWTAGRAQPLRDPTGAIVQWFGVCVDIDDLVNARNALRESEQNLQRLVDALPTQIWAAKPDGEPTYLNHRLSQFVGFGLGELEVPDISRLQAAIQGSVHPDDASAVGAALRRAFSSGEPFAMKYRQRRADGVYRWISGRAEPLRDSENVIRQWYGVSYDIDDDVRTQEELRQTRERLAAASQAASLAELSASIAHEVNQPLAAAVANSYAAQRWLDTDPPNSQRARVAVERVVRDANSVAEVVGRIRALFRQSRSRRTPVDIGGAIMEARSLLTDEAERHRVRIEIHMEPGLPPAPSDRVQLQQVLINLMRNAIEAMVTVSGERVLTVGARCADGGIEVEVTDTGTGIAQPERVFEAFFTTKESGMGMGLAISRNIVEAHGGRLKAEPHVPHGTRFSFTLPLAASNE